MHLDLALLLSEAKGELRFYKSEVLKDALYYSCGGRAADGSTGSRPLQGWGSIQRTNPSGFADAQPPFNSGMIATGNHNFERFAALCNTLPGEAWALRAGFGTTNTTVSKLNIMPS